MDIKKIVKEYLDSKKVNGMWFNKENELREDIIIDFLNWVIAQNKSDSMKVYLVTSGDGSDGNEWHVVEIFSTMELAWEYRSLYGWGFNVYGKGYDHDWDIEEWIVNTDLAQ